MEPLSLTEVITAQNKISHFAKKWETVMPNLSYVDFRSVPNAYRMITLREAVSEVSHFLDKGFAVTRQLNKVCEVSTDEENNINSAPDLFSGDAGNVVDSYCNLHTNIDATCNELIGDLYNLDPDGDLVDPSDVFDVAQYRSLLKAIYLLDIRGAASGALYEPTNRIVRVIFGILQSLLESTFDDQQIMIPTYISTGVITLKFESQRVYYTEEELEEIRRQKYEAEQEAHRAAELKTRMSKVGKFVDDLYTVIHENPFQPDNGKRILTVMFPDADLEKYAKPVDDETVDLLEDLKHFLADNSNPSVLDDHEELTKALRRLCSMLHRINAGEELAINRTWMSPEQLNRISKFFVDRGYKVRSLITMTYLDGNLDTTRAHFREVFVLTTE